MRRILFVLTVAALMAAMMISAGPAQANNLNFGNSTNVVQFGNSFVGFGDIDDDGIFGCCRHHNGIDFDDDGIDFDGIFGCCRHHNGIDFGDNDNEISVNFGGF
jgi:hypothetical protein